MSAPDIFLSYSREDADRARLFAEGFAAAGLQVWWDVELRSGEAYDKVTEDALSDARAVVVLWSPRSAQSRWVRAEATAGERNRTLVPAMIEPCKRPIMFELLQTAELSHWRGDRSDPAWRAFLSDVHRIIGSPAGSVAESRNMIEAPAAPAGLSIVVLPFTNMSGDPEQEYFADGISEDIITDLAKVSSLAIIARNTAFTFKGRHVDVTAVAQQLRVSHVLEGSVRRSGDRLRVTAQLIDGATGAHLWAERYDRKLEDVFDLQDELSEAIVGALKVRLLPEERRDIEQRNTRNLEAYDLYKRARAMRGSHSGEHDEVIRLYRSAVALDPEFAMAWAGLSTALQFKMGLHTESAQSPALQAEMEHASAEARKLAPNLPDVLSSRSHHCLMARDWKEAEICLDLWQRLPNEHWSIRSHLLLFLGRARESVGSQIAVVKSDPLSIGARAVLQFNRDCAGEMETAEMEYGESRELAGGMEYLHWTALLRAMARGDHTLVKQRFQNHFASGSRLFPWSKDVALLLDRPPEVLALLRRLFETPDALGTIQLDGVSSVAAYLGDSELAFAALHRTYVESRILPLSTFWHPVYAALRPDPRFRQMLKDIGLVAHWHATGNWGDFARPLPNGGFELVN